MKPVTLCCALFYVLLAIPPPCQADSARMLDPFEGISELSIEVFFGGNLRIESRGHRRLFDGEGDRAKAFEKKLFDQVANGLGRCGIKSVENWSRLSHGLQVGVFGGPVNEARTPGVYMFLVRVVVFKNEGADSDGEETFEMRLLGAADDGELEAEISRTVHFALEEATYDCRQKVRRCGGVETFASHR